MFLQRFTGSFKVSGPPSASMGAALGEKESKDKKNGIKDRAAAFASKSEKLLVQAAGINSVPTGVLEMATE